MKKQIFLVAVLLAVLGGCSGNKDDSTIEDKWVYDDDYTQKYPYNYPYTIIGKVVCSSCTTESPMYVNVEDEDDIYLVSRAWSGAFGDGTYKLTDVILESGKNIHLRVFIDGIYPSGKKSDVITLTDDYKQAITAPTVTIP